MKTQLSERDRLRLKHAAELVENFIHYHVPDSFDAGAIMSRDRLQEAVDLVRKVFADGGVETEIISMGEEAPAQGPYPGHPQGPGSEAKKIVRLHFDLFDKSGKLMGYVVAIDGKVCYGGIRGHNGPCEHISWALGLDGKTFHNETKRRGWTYQKGEAV